VISSSSDDVLEKEENENLKEENENEVTSSSSKKDPLGPASCLLPGAKKTTADVVWCQLRLHLEEGEDFIKWDKLNTQAVWRDVRFALRKNGLHCPTKQFKRRWYQGEAKHFACDNKKLFLLGMDCTLAQIERSKRTNSAFSNPAKKINEYTA